MGRVLRGDLGTSVVTRREIAPELVRKIPWTATLMVCAGVLAGTLAVPLAVASARGGIAGLAADSVLVLGLVAPVFLVATLLSYAFAVRLTWIPILPPFDPNLLDGSLWRGLLLPSASLALPAASVAAVQMRGDLRAALSTPAVSAAGFGGVLAARSTVRHALRAAGRTVLAHPLPLAGLGLSGLLVVEEIYTWPGVGRTFFRAVTQRDIPIMQAGLLLFAALAVVIDLAARVTARRSHSGETAGTAAAGLRQDRGRGSPIGRPGPKSRAAAALVVALALASAALPLIARFPADRVLLDEIHLPPSFRHWMGTDSSGRDMLSRLLLASRASMGIALGGAAAAVLGGLVLGGLVVSAAPQARQGRGAVAAWVLRSVASVPTLVLALAVVAVTGRSAVTIGAVLAITGTAWVAWRLGPMLAEANAWTFVLAARAAGASPLWVAERHVLPHLVRPLLAAAAGLVPGFLAMEATLGFLGFSLSPTTPTWGTLLWRGREALHRGDWWLLAFPALFLAAAAWAYAALAEALAEPPPPTYVKRTKPALVRAWKPAVEGRPAMAARASLRSGAGLSGPVRAGMRDRRGGRPRPSSAS
jgi:peptide/nickel transport system permease protein